MDVDTKKAEKIATLNDAFRRTTFEIMLTPGIRELDDLSELLAAVRRFVTFTEDNDPYGEHDFGSIDWRPERVFWKITYYDQDLKYWCDPLSKKCVRVLTVMLASEY